MTEYDLSKINREVPVEVQPIVTEIFGILCQLCDKTEGVQIGKGFIEEKYPTSVKEWRKFEVWLYPESSLNPIRGIFGLEGFWDRYDPYPKGSAQRNIEVYLSISAILTENALIRAVEEFIKKRDGAIHRLKGVYKALLD